MKIPEKILQKVVTKSAASGRGVRTRIKVFGHPLIPDGKTVYLYRYKMINKLGRLLSKDELVHHKNNDKMDNSINNLEIKSNPEHTKLHAREMWDQRSPEKRAEIGQKISRSKKGKPQPWIHDVIDKYVRGKPRSEEFKQKVSEGMKKMCATLPNGEMARRLACTTKEAKQRGLQKMQVTVKNRTPEEKAAIHEKLSAAAKNRSSGWKEHLSQKVKEQWASKEGRQKKLEGMRKR